MTSYKDMKSLFINFFTSLIFVKYFNIKSKNFEFEISKKLIYFNSNKNLKTHLNAKKI